MFEHFCEPLYVPAVRIILLIKYYRNRYTTEVQYRESYSKGRISIAHEMLVCEAVLLRTRSNIHRKLRGSYENIDIEITEARGRGGKFRLARSNNDERKKRAGRKYCQPARETLAEARRLF